MALNSEIIQKHGLQAAKDVVEPDRSQHGPIFYVNQTIEMSGGRFRVYSIGKRMLVLESLPGTTLK